MVLALFVLVFRNGCGTLILVQHILSNLDFLLSNFDRLVSNLDRLAADIERFVIGDSVMVWQARTGVVGQQQRRYWEITASRITN